MTSSDNVNSLSLQLLAVGYNLHSEKSPDHGASIDDHEVQLTVTRDRLWNSGFQAAGEIIDAAVKLIIHARNACAEIVKAWLAFAKHAVYLSYRALTLGVNVG